jgi:hypothetical protein
MCQLGRLALSIASLAVITYGCITGARAMQFSTIPLDDPGTVIIGAVGEIIPGDLDRLIIHLRHLPTGSRVAGYALDSPGGNVFEAEKIASGLRRVQATVGVLGQSRCVSACFLVFASGVKKLASVTALIGVHSVSEAGAETTESMSLTTAMARDAADFGVPPGIIGKMVTATPGQMEWLTQHDLISMGVTILQPDPQQHEAPAPVAMSPPTPPTGMAATVAPPASPPESTTFQQGAADRRTLEQWFASLSGVYSGGAKFWAEHRSDRQTPSCYGNGGLNPGEFTAGCLMAQQRLTNSDVRRKSDPDYRRGWNSY